VSSQFSLISTSASTTTTAAPVQNSFFSLPSTVSSSNFSLFQPVSSTSSSGFLVPQVNNNGIFGSNSVNSFAVQPDLVNATTTMVSQPAIMLGAAQSSSSLFPVANHNTSQPSGFGLSVEPSSPVFAFGAQSSVTAVPNMFGAVTSLASVARNSFVSPFAGLNQNNSQNAPSFGFLSPAIPSTFNFGELISNVYQNLVSCGF